MQQCVSIIVAIVWKDHTAFSISVKWPKKQYNTEDEAVIIGNIRNHNPRDTEKQCRRLESLDTILLSFPNTEDTCQM